MTPTRLAEIKAEFAALSEIGEVDFDMGMSSALKLIGELVAEVERLQPKPHGDDLQRIIREIDAQDGNDVDAEDLTEEEWAKVKSTALSDYGSPVTIVFVQDKGFEDTEPIKDHGCLTALPGRYDTWDMVGIVHIPRPWVEKERPIPEWHSLYSLCRNNLVAEIVIGPRAFTHGLNDLSR